ncbi:formylglycine-generating enzyme family protein [Anabaena sp. CCY 9402-a]|uniref:formylglycine-generating enzyme family protein n=1 Tax=Anabaena sp. CCY 9402-a TaxID=3103867 RepID=UPI0039C5C5B8
MCGDIYEWCQDVYNDSYQGAPKDGSPWLTGSDDSMNLLRGGSWLNSARHCRSAFRYGYDRVDRHGRVGFRVAVAVA